jgi:hypothetical protein
MWRRDRPAPQCRRSLDAESPRPCLLRCDDRRRRRRPTLATDTDTGSRSNSGRRRRRPAPATNSGGGGNSRRRRDDARRRRRRPAPATNSGSRDNSRRRRDALRLVHQALCRVNTRCRQNSGLETPTGAVGAPCVQPHTTAALPLATVVTSTVID